jgi:hypothetical protein
MPDPPKPGIKDKIIAFLSHEPQWYWKYYKFELFMIVFFLIAIAKLCHGKGVNNTVAMIWRKTAIPVFFNEFERLGCEEENKKSLAVMQRSYSEFDYFASGRKNCHYIDFRLNLLRR